MTSLKRGLPARYFVDASIYEQETRQIFQREWLCVGHSSPLNKLHRFQTYDIEGTSILVMRSENGLRAFHNICRHRGAKLCESEAGTLQNGCLQCPYHAWTYDSHGTLQAAPNMHSAEEFDAQEFGLVEIDCVDWQGMLLVNFSSSTQDFAEQFAPVLHQFDPWNLTGLTVGASLTYKVAANWKLLFQNFSECYHCPTVHPALAQLTPYKSASNDLLAGGFLGGPMLLAERAETMSTDGRRVGPLLPGLETLRRQVAYYTIFPNLFVSPHPDYVMLHRIYRQSAGETRVVCDFLFDSEACHRGEVETTRATNFWDTVNRQDWHVCELVQKSALAAAAHSIAPGPYGPLETVLPEFDAHYLAAMNRADA